jgi:iron complex outermembrane receptor protein
MSKTSAKKLFSYFIVAVAVFNPAWVFAQEETEEGLKLEEKADPSLSIQEVVVTARKGKAEDLQIVPIAINAISEQSIEEKGITGVEDVAKMVSGLTFDTGLLPNDTRPTLRGLSTTRGRSNVATLIDYVDISSEALATAGGGMTGNMRLTDLERVEVIKGPQTVMYGRSAFSGAINYVTRRPTLDTPEGSISTDLAVLNNNANALNASSWKGMYTAPINDTLGYRINVAQSEGDGAFQNPNTGGDLNTENTLGGAGAILFAPTDVFSSYTRYEYSDEEYSPRAQVLRRTVDNNPVLGDYVGAVNSPLDPGASENPVPYDGKKGYYNSGQFLRDGVKNQASAYNANGTPKVQCNLDQVPFRNRNPSTDSFEPTGNGQYCRPILVGSQYASESEVDFSADPTNPGKDFRGTELENQRLHQEFDWDFDTFSVVSTTAYTKSDTNIKEDFDLTDYSLYGGTKDSNGNYATLYNPNASANINCNGQPSNGVPYQTPGSGDCISQYGFQTAMDITYGLKQFNQEIRVSGSTDQFNWMVSGLFWSEELDTTLNDRWWLRQGGTDIVNSEFVSPGLAQTGNMPFGPQPDCFGADKGDISKGCYRTAPSYAQTSPIKDYISRDTDHTSIAASLTWNVSDTVAWTNEMRALQEDITYKGSGSLLHGLSSAFGNCGGFMVPFGEYEMDPNDVNGNGKTSEILESTEAGLAGYLIPDVHGQCQSQENQLDTITEYVPRSSVNWQVDDEMMLYFTYAEGFKPGGIDTTNASSLVAPSDLDHETVVKPQDQLVDANGDGVIDSADSYFGVNRERGYSEEFQPEYKPEKLKTFEVGMKSEWLDGQVLFNSSVYFYKYTDQQLPLLVKVGAGGLVAPTTVNAGESRVKGFEFDLTDRLTESITLAVGYTYSDAYYESFNTQDIAAERFGGESGVLLSGSAQADAGNGEGDFTGNQLPFSAKHSVTWDLRYDTSFDNGLDGFADLGGSWQSKRYMSSGNNAYLKPYDLWNFSAGISNENWSGIFYIDNLLNDDTIRSGILNTDYGYGVSYEFDLAQAANLVLPQQRTFGVRLEYKF